MGVIMEGNEEQSDWKVDCSENSFERGKSVRQRSNWSVFWGEGKAA